MKDSSVRAMLAIACFSAHLRTYMHSLCAKKQAMGALFAKIQQLFPRPEDRYYNRYRKKVNTYEPPWY